MSPRESGIPEMLAIKSSHLLPTFGTIWSEENLAQAISKSCVKEQVEKRHFPFHKHGLYPWIS